MTGRSLLLDRVVLESKRDILNYVITCKGAIIEYFSCLVKLELCTFSSLKLKKVFFPLLLKLLYDFLYVLTPSFLADEEGVGSVHDDEIL